MSLNVKNPYRRQKRDLSIVRSSFRRPLYTGIEILTINIITFLPTTSIISYLFIFLRPYRLLPIFLSSYDHIDYFLPSCDHIDYFLPFCDHIDYFLISYLLTFLRLYRLLNNPYSLSQSEHAGFTMLRHNK
jgi:hypothetical protein